MLPEMSCIVGKPAPSHPTVCFKSNPLVECRRRIETKNMKVTKDLPESCGLDTASAVSAGVSFGRMA